MPLTSSSGGSLVSPSPLLASSEPSKMTGGSGHNLPESFAFYDRNASSWKTCQGCLFEGLATYSGIWLPCGTMRSGRLFQRPQWERRIEGTAFGCLPTPSASEGNRDSLTVESLVKRGEKHQWGNLAEWMAQRHGYKPSPRFVELMMGFPRQWTVLDVSVIPSSPKSQKWYSAKSKSTRKG